MNERIVFAKLHRRIRIDLFVISARITSVPNMWRQQSMGKPISRLNQVKEKLTDE